MKRKLEKTIAVALVGVLSVGTTINAATVEIEENIKMERKVASPTMKMHGERFNFSNNELLNILNVTDEELKELLQNDNLFSVLENANKLEEYKELMRVKHQERIENLVTEGKITQEKAERILEKFEEHILNLNGENTENLKKGHKLHLNIDGERLEVLDIQYDDELLELLNVSKEELKELLQNDNLFTILQNTNKLEEYKELMEVRHQERMQNLVSEGKITQEEASKLLEKFEEHMQNFNGEDINNFKMGHKFIAPAAIVNEE